MYIIKNFFVLLLISSTVYAQKVSTMELDSILNRIAGSNIQLQSMELRSQSYQFAAEAGTAWMAPMIGLGNYMTPYPGQMTMPGANSSALMFQIEQDIPSLAKLKTKKQYILSKERSEKAQIGIVLNEYKSQAKSLFYSWLIAKAKIKILESSRQNIQTINKVEQSRFTFNQSRLGDVYLTEAKFNEINNQITALEGEISNNKARLNSLMNRPSNTDFEINEKNTPIFIAENIDNIHSLEKRMDILKMDADINSMRLNIANMNAQRKPDFKIRFDHMSPLTKGMPKAFSLMGMMSIPIVPWSSKMYKNETKAMQLEIEAMQLQKQAMLNESKGIRYGIQTQILKMQKQIFNMDTKILPLLQKVLDVNLLNYRENKLSLKEVLDSWDALQMMQNQVLDEKLKLYLMIVDYEKELYR